MKQKDNLEQLYRDRYKDLKTTPREDLWAGIAARLPEKDTKRRTVPLLYRIAGAAALVSLLAILAVELLNPLNEVTTKIVYIQNPQNSKIFNVVSEEFEKNMANSAKILESLADGRVTSKKEQISNPAEKYQQVSKSSTGLANNHEEILPEISKDRIVVQEKMLVSLYPQNRMANLEPDLNDLPLETPKEEEMSDIELTNTAENRFQFKTTAAAVYFDNLGRGNAIDNEFAGNRGEGDISFSYGLAIAYSISDKISIRSGINKVDLSYNTREVSYGAALSATAVQNNEARAVSLASPVMGNLNQSLGFIEVPLELKYGIINEKIGLNLIGGASTLFLNDNHITLEAGMASTSLGEAGNLNDISFTTNVGVGVDYNISPQFQLNVEPIFKYQINTFNNTSNVKPYYFGIYSGLSFRF